MRIQDYNRFKLSPEAISILQAVKQHVTEEPRRLDMCQWLGTKQNLCTIAITQMERDALNPPCGTVACLAGNVCILYASQRGKPHEVLAWDIEHKAAEILGFADTVEGDYVREHMFYVAGWPSEFSAGYYSHIYSLEMLKHNAKLFARYIDYVCQYGIPYIT